MSSFLLFIPLALFFLFSTAVVIYSTLGVEKAPKFLRPVLRHVEKAIEAMESAAKEDYEANMRQQFPVPLKSERNSTDRFGAAAKAVNPPVQTRQSPADARFFALQEIALNCGFTPQIEGGELLVTAKELGRLQEYCAFAFDNPLSADQLLEPLGLQVRKVQRRR